MQEAEKAESSRNLSYSEYYRLVDVVLKASLDELKLRSIDRRLAQDAKLRQILYLSITIAAAIGAIVTLTPYWNPVSAVLVQAQLWHMVLLAISFVICSVAFCFGVWALMGERGGAVPMVYSYGNILVDGYGEDGSGRAYEAMLSWIERNDEDLEEYAQIIEAKAKKIRALNWMLVCAAGCATLAAFALFSTTIYENYVKQRYEAETTALSVTQDSVGSINKQDKLTE